MSEMLDRYNEIQEMIAFLQAEVADIESALRVQVEETGTVAGYGWIAQLKPGRKSTDHEAAVRDAVEFTNFNALHDMAHKLREAQERHTTTKVTTAWAQITKAAGLDVELYTTQAPPVFVVERVVK